MPKKVGTIRTGPPPVYINPNGKNHEALERVHTISEQTGRTLSDVACLLIMSAPPVTLFDIFGKKMDKPQVPAVRRDK